MIRIYRSTTEGFARARQAIPLVTAATLQEALRQLASSKACFAELEAVRKAAGCGPLPSAVDIVLAPGGSLYRVYEAEADPPVDPQPARTFSAQEGARALVVGPDPLAASLRDALRFLGYAAVSTDPEADGATQALEAALAHDPLLVVVTDGRAVGVREMVAALRARPRAIVSLGDEPGEPGTFDAVVPLPVRLGRLASLLDPLIQHAKGKRSRADGPVLDSR